MFSKNGVLWNSENLSFNTFKISHHFRYKFQKNTVRQRLMKHLVVLVEKSKLGDIPKFHNFLTSFSDNESSCRGHLGGLHSSSLIFSELIRLIYRFTWLSNTFIRCLFSRFCGSAVGSPEVCKSLSLYNSSRRQIWFASASTSMKMNSLFQPRSQAS